MTEKTHLNGGDPTDSKQGIYTCTPAGELLKAKNTLEADEAVSLLEKALAKWDALPKEKRLAKTAPTRAERPDDLYPEDGLALHVIARDLPREGHDTKLWNQEHVWFRKSELQSFLPEKLVAGEKREAPLLARRLGATGLLDCVKGETDKFQDEHVKEATLTFFVKKVENARVTLRIFGHTKAVQEGVWSVAGFKDMDHPTKQKRSLDLKLEGEAVWEKEKGRFSAFELVAVGERTGGTQYNARAGDLAAAPIGFWIELAATEDRVAPTWVENYEWERVKKTWR
jgi:hypothetical protein